MNEAAPAVGARSPLAAGTLIGERFQIQQLASVEDGCESYWATDTKAAAPALVRIVAVSAAVRPTFEADIRRALTISHGNLVPLLGAGTFHDRIYVASAVEDGHSLRQLIDAQRSQGKALGVASAHTILGHVVTGILDGLKGDCHGGINPESIWITRSGRIKLGDVGLARAVPSLARRGSGVGHPGGLYTAPEVLNGGPASPESDVFSLGAILYEMLTATPPAPPLRPPSQVLAGVPAALDGVVARAMAGSSVARFASPAQFVSALGAAMSGKTGGESGTDPARPTIGKPFNVAAAAGGLSGEAERWLIQRDKLDFGPFSLQQVMAQLEQGAFSPDHLIVDMDSGVRVKIKDHPQLGEFANKTARKLEQVRRAQAEHATESVERKKSRAAFLIVGAAVVGVGGLVGVFLWNRTDAEQATLQSRASESGVDEFLKNVKLSLVQPKRPAARRASSGGPKGDEFSNDLNLGDVTKGGGDEILSDGVINNVMMARYRSLVPCLMEERRRNPSVTVMDLEFVVRGTGKVSAVRVNGESKGPFASCVHGRMQSFAFPSYNGSKTIASWSMSLK